MVTNFMLVDNAAICSLWVLAFLDAMTNWLCQIWDSWSHSGMAMATLRNNNDAITINNFHTWYWDSLILPEVMVVLAGLNLSCRLDHPRLGHLFGCIFKLLLKQLCSKLSETHTHTLHMWFQKTFLSSLHSLPADRFQHFLQNKNAMNYQILVPMIPCVGVYIPLHP